MLHWDWNILPELPNDSLIAADRHVGSPVKLRLLWIRGFELYCSVRVHETQVAQLVIYSNNTRTFFKHVHSKTSTHGYVGWLNDENEKEISETENRFLSGEFVTHQVVVRNIYRIN